MKLVAMLFAVVVLVLAGCESDEAGEQVSSTGASQHNPGTVKLTSNGTTLEQENIKRRIETTTDPGGLAWIHLMSSNGKVVARMVVQGKVTSSGKRLQPKIAERDGTGHTLKLPRTRDGYFTNELIQPDGTYGQSDAYIFWFDPQDRYHQLSTSSTGIAYLLTNYPIVLNSSTDAITGMFKLDAAAAAWALNQKGS